MLNMEQGTSFQQNISGFQVLIMKIKISAFYEKCFDLVSAFNFRPSLGISFEGIGLNYIAMQKIQVLHKIPTLKKYETILTLSYLKLNKKMQNVYTAYPLLAYEPRLELIFLSNTFLIMLLRVFLRKMLGTWYGVVGTWFLWF